jgi:phosphatidylinositol glycan class B
MIEKLYQYRIQILFVVYSLLVFFSEGYYHFDEHFQVIEFAGLKFGINQASDLPWEYHSQLRSGLMPLIVFILAKGFQFLHIYNPFHLAFSLRMLSAILALYTTQKLVEFLVGDFNRSKIQKVFYLTSFFLWFAAFNKVRFSSENWSVCIFILGWINLSKQGIGYFKLFQNGLLLGCSFLLKFQLGFFIAGLFAWLLFMRRENILKLITLFVGLIIAVALGALIDYWLYGKWVLTCWNYLQQLLFAKYTGSFENEPWWYFFDEAFNKGVPPISIFMLLAMLYFFVYEYKNVVTWIVFPFLFIHFFIGHKEIRFLFPVIPFIPYILIKSHESAREKLKWYAQIIATKWANVIWKITVTLNIIFLVIVCFKSADSQIDLYKFVYNSYDKPGTIYFLDNNPYHRVLDIHFYKKENLVFQKVDSLPQLIAKPKEVSLFVTDKNLDQFPTQVKLTEVYNSYPKWIYNFNYNNWLSRSRSWHVYEVSY